MFNLCCLTFPIATHFCRQPSGYDFFFFFYYSEEKWDENKTRNFHFHLHLQCVCMFVLFFLLLFFSSSLLNYICWSYLLFRALLHQCKSVYRMFCLFYFHLSKDRNKDNNFIIVCQKFAAYCNDILTHCLAFLVTLPHSALGWGKLWLRLITNWWE